jgi:nucleoside-diphosphate-sugar epimerase
MKVLVTGSAGVVGQPVWRELARRGHEVRGLDRAPTPELGDAIVADIADAEAVRAAVRGMDAVAHLAAQPVEAPFAELVGPNVVGLFNVMNAAREEGVRRVVLTSSMMVVASREIERPARTDAARPVNHYALTKLWAEQMGKMYAQQYGMSVVAVRLGWVVRDPDEARKMQQLAIPDVYASRADAARLYAAAIEAEEIGFEIVYAASRGGERVFDMEPARRLFGFEPRETWPEGLPFPLPPPPPPPDDV